MQKIPYWDEVYPQGTKEGNNEFEFFHALARHKQTWRSAESISEETGLPIDIVEGLIEKYFRKGMIIAHESREGVWAYWEKIPDKIPKHEKSLSDEDHDNRVNFYCGDDAVFMRVLKEMKDY